MSAVTCAASGEFEDHNPVPNWELAKALYFKGLPNKQIVSKANVSLAALWQRIAREGWNTTRTNTNAILSVTVETGKVVHAGMSESDATQSQNTSSTLLQRLQKRLEAITKGWDSQSTPKSLRGQREALQLLSQASDIGKVLFGWGLGSGGSTIRLEVLQSASHPSLQPAQAIDVPSSTVPELPSTPPEHVEGRP